MKNILTIALFGAVLAVTTGIVSTGVFSDVSTDIQNDHGIKASSLALLGHAEFIVHGADGAIKQYVQTDNVVAVEGRDCVAQLLFKNGTNNICTPSSGYSGFRYIAIGNGTAGATVDDTVLSTAGGGGEVLRSSAVEPGFTQATSNSNIAEVTLSNAFTITDTQGTTTITESGLFDTTSGGNMFAIVNIPNSGVSVGDGDTLTVNWTVSIGN